MVAHHKTGDQQSAAEQNARRREAKKQQREVRIRRAAGLPVRLPRPNDVKDGLDERQDLVFVANLSDSLRDHFDALIARDYSLCEYIDDVEWCFSEYVMKLRDDDNRGPWVYRHQRAKKHVVEGACLQGELKIQVEKSLDHAYAQAARGRR